MRLPRNLSGDELIQALTRLGYEVSRQSGSHIRLTIRIEQGEYHVTIPRHCALARLAASSVM